MDVSEQIRCIRAICQKLKEMVDLKFPAYGSLYLTETPHLPTSKLALNREFCIGPHCGARYWNCNIGQPRYYHGIKPNQGPWRDVAAYCDALIDNGISRLPPAGSVSKRPRYQGSVETHRKLLGCGRAMVKEMVKNSSIQNAACPAMFHPDLHTRNIFVSEKDPTVVSAIIDWQSTSIEPAFWYADATPDFALPQPISNPSGEEDTMEPKSEACAKAYNACIHFLAPKLSAARSIHEAYLRPFRYCHRTWEDSAAAFREELIQTSRLWEELGFAVPCPFPFPCAEEIALHKKGYRFFEAAIQLRRGLERLLDTPSDWWVPADDWEGIRSKHWELFERMRRDVRRNEQLDDDEPIRSEEDLREIWPFDLEE